MAEFESIGGMQDIRTVIRDPLRFKLKLDIGDQTYSSLRLKKYLLDSVDAANGAATGLVFAKSSLVASTFFAPSGFLGVLGIGTAATPVGWAIGAGIAGAGLSLIVGKRFIKSSSSRVKQIPEFINTPMDVLATGLFDMIGTLGVKLAEIEGRFVPEEREFWRQNGATVVDARYGLSERRSPGSQRSGLSCQHVTRDLAIGCA